MAQDLRKTKIERLAQTKIQHAKPMHQNLESKTQNPRSKKPSAQN
ncbi:hypothetical protein [Helicobacter sp. CLO-3]|nr:hypothetical protein [Helicobacter sp. CLO-3]